MDGLRQTGEREREEIVWPRRESCLAGGQTDEPRGCPGGGLVGGGRRQAARKKKKKSRHIKLPPRPSMQLNIQVVAVSRNVSTAFGPPTRRSRSSAGRSYSSIWSSCISRSSMHEAITTTTTTSSAVLSSFVRASSCYCCCIARIYILARLEEEEEERAS